MLTAKQHQHPLDLCLDYREQVISPVLTHSYMPVSSWLLYATAAFLAPIPACCSLSIVPTECAHGHSEDKMFSMLTIPEAVHSLWLRHLACRIWSSHTYTLRYKYQVCGHTFIKRKYIIIYKCIVEHSIFFIEMCGGMWVKKKQDDPVREILSCKFMILQNITFDNSCVLVLFIKERMKKTATRDTINKKTGNKLT